MSHKISNAAQASIFEKYLNIEHPLAGTGGKMSLGWVVEIPHFISFSIQANSDKSSLSRYINKILEANLGWPWLLQAGAELLCTGSWGCWADPWFPWHPFQPPSSLMSPFQDSSVNSSLWNLFYTGIQHTTAFPSFPLENGSAWEYSQIFKPFH